MIFFEILVGITIFVGNIYEVNIVEKKFNIYIIAGPKISTIIYYIIQVK